MIPFAIESVIAEAASGRPVTFEKVIDREIHVLRISENQASIEIDYETAVEVAKWILRKERTQ